MTQSNVEERQPFEEAIVNMFKNQKYANDYMFYAHLVGQCAVVFEKMDAPAAVGFDLDHYNLYINPESFNKFSLMERLAVIKHEMLHIMNNHVMRTEDRHHKAWNFSTDCAINQLIEREHLPKGCIFPDNFPYKKNKSPVFALAAEQYYDLIDDSGNDEGDGDGSGEGEEGGTSGAGGDQFTSMDSHGKWNTVGEDTDTDIQKDITKGMLDKAMENTVKSRGNIPSSYADCLNLFTRKAEVSWQKVLRGITGNKRTNNRRTIMRSDRRFPHRSDLRGKTKDRTFNLLVVADVSGSVDDQALLALLSEVKHICDVTKSDIDLVQIDSRAHEPEKITKNMKIVNRKARGGTNLFPAVTKAKECGIDFQAIVVTTDGWLSESDVRLFEKTGKKIIWLVEQNGQIMPEMQRGLMKAFKLKK